MQPAWSLDPLWIPIREVAIWRFFLQHEVPLQRACELHRGDANVAAETRWTTNRNILGGPLRSLTTDFGFGIGLQSPGQLQLPLPSDCVVLRTVVCLDRLAGRGGCAKSAHLRTNNNQPLWESPLLQGGSGGRYESPVNAAEVTAVGGRTRSSPSRSPDWRRPLLHIRDHINLADGWLELEPAAVYSPTRTPRARTNRGVERLARNTHEEYVAAAESRTGIYARAAIRN